MTPAATMEGEEGVKLAAINPERIAGMACAIAATLAFIPSISPCIPGPTDLLISPVIFACERPLANAKNGVTISRPQMLHRQDQKYLPFFGAM